jgi:hypothetical protein
MISIYSLVLYVRMTLDVTVLILPTRNLNSLGTSSALEHNNVLAYFCNPSYHEEAIYQI